MRLNRTAKLIEKNLHLLEASITSSKYIQVSTSGRNGRIQGIEEIGSALRELNTLDFMQDKIKNIHRIWASIYIVSEKNYIDVPSMEYRKFIDRITDLASQLKLVLSAIRSALPAENTLAVNVKLPANVKDLSDLSKFADQINKCFSQTIVNPAIDGSITIDAFEPGSKWISLNLGTKEAVQVIGVLVWACVVVNGEIQNNALMEETLRSRQLQNDALSHVVEANKTQIDLLLHNEAKLINDENFGGDPEQLERLKYSIKTFSEIIRNGGDIQPSLNAPKDLKSEYPTDIPVNLIESRTKKLSQSIEG